MKALARVDLLARDLTITERSLPAHMLFLMMEQCQKIGLELRADVMQHLNVASIAPLSQLDTLSVVRIAKRVDEAARSLLNDLSPDDPREGMYCCATFILTLVAEGRLEDKGNQAVLVALMLLDDVKDRKPDVTGQEAVWRVNEARWGAEAKKLLHRANLLGFYLTATRN